jgi:hypothetical protein
MRLPLKYRNNEFILAMISFGSLVIWSVVVFPLYIALLPLVLIAELVTSGLPILLRNSDQKKLK